MKAVCNVYSVVLAVVFFFISFPAHAIESGDNVSGTITNAQPEHSYTFLAQGGDSVVLSLGSEIDFEIDLRSPSGVLLASGDRVIQNALPQSGTYSVTVRGRFPTFVGNYTLHFVKAPDVTEHDTIESGSNFIGNIELGDIESFSFEGEAGENVTLSSAFTGDRFDVVIGLYGPDGRFLNESGSFGDSFINYRLPETGKYSVVIMGRFTTFFGEYDFHFVKSSGASEYGTLVGGLEYEHNITKADIDSFKFSGSEGDAIEISSTGDVSRTTYIYAPDGSRVLARDNSNPLRIVSLPQTGTYTVIVVGRFTTFTGNYLLSFHASNQLMQITQAVFHEGDVPIKLVHERTTAIILDKNAPNYDETLDLKPRITLTGEDEPIFPKEGQSFREENTETHKVFYCDGGNNYCNLEKDGLYEVSVTDGTSNFALQTVEVKETNMLELFFIGLTNFNCLPNNNCDFENGFIESQTSKSNEYISKVFPIPDKGLTLVTDLENDSLGSSLVDITAGAEIGGSYEGYRIADSIQATYADLLKIDSYRKNRSLFTRGVGFVSSDYFEKKAKSSSNSHRQDLKGITYPGLKVVLAEIDGTENVVAHEIGHTFKLPENGQPEEYLLDNDDKLVSRGVPASGFDIKQLKFKNPENTYNYMAASGLEVDRYWVNYRTWNFTLSELSKNIDDPKLIYIPLIFSKDGTVESLYWSETEGFPDFQDEGTHSIEIYDAGNFLIKKYKFTPTFKFRSEPFGEFDSDVALFTILAEYPLKAIKIVLKDENEIILLEEDPMIRTLQDLKSDIINTCSFIDKEKIEEILNRFIISLSNKNLKNSKVLFDKFSLFIFERVDNCKLSLYRSTDKIDAFFKSINQRLDYRVSKLDGDFDNDGDVDRRDLKILKASRKQLVEGDDDPRDLNKDGKINRKDVKILKSLCTRPKCAKK